jgi:hypothetical protein
MKTPRDILLARHQSVTPKLDGIRHEAVNSQFHQRSFAAAISDFLGMLWRELILPSRRIWTGLAAIWILIFVANVSMRGHSEIKMANSSPTREMILTYRQQEQLLTELIGPNDPPVAEPQKKYSPRPASQRPIGIITV